MPVAAARGAVGVDFGLPFAEPASGLAAHQVRNATGRGADPVRSGDRVGVASLLGGPAGLGDAVGVGEDVGHVVVLGVQVGVLGTAVAVGPAEVVRWVGLDESPEARDFLGVAVEREVRALSDDPQPGRQVFVGEEVTAVVDTNPPFAVAGCGEFGEHRLFPAGQVIEHERQIGLVLGFHRREQEPSGTGVADFAANSRAGTGVVGTSVGQSAGPGGQRPGPHADRAQSRVLAQQPLRPRRVEVFGAG